MPNEKGSGDLPSCRREGLKLVGKGKRCIKPGGAAMWSLKSCPKCGGDVFIDDDMNGWYEQCLQCGYLHDLRTIVEVKEQPRERKREPVLAGRKRRTAAD